MPLPPCLSPHLIPIHLPRSVPASFLRSLFFKLALDIHRMPALRELVRLTAGWLTGKDDSDWERALLLPHFRDTMPAVRCDAQEVFC